MEVVMKLHFMKIALSAGLVLAGASGAIAQSTTKESTTKEVVSQPPGCQIANRFYSDGAVVCNGTRIKLTCTGSKWTPVEADTVLVCTGAPFIN
jgi:hypothetical protein